MTPIQPSNTSAQDTPKKTWLQQVLSLNYWQNQNRWLLLLVMILVSVLLTYLLSHDIDKQSTSKDNDYFGEPHEAEFKTLDDKDISYITSLINQGSTFILQTTADESNDDDTNQITKSIPSTANLRFKSNPNNRVVKEYILTQMPNVYPQDTVQIFALLDEQPNSLSVAFIENARFRIKSYFWLAGPHTYLEVIFWTIFGVITSILFYIADAISKGNSFRPTETPGHLAKIAYSPFISLIIIFSYNYLSNPDSAIDVSSSKGTLIISFLLGFYSSRAMKLLDKLKDVLLPYGETANTPTEKPVTAAIQQETKTATVTVAIGFNDPSHQDEEELNAHIAQTQLSLQPKSGGDNFSFTKTGEDELEGIFAAQNVPTGSYTLTASLTTTDGDNYTASQEVEVVDADNNFTLTLTKTDVSG